MSGVLTGFFAGATAAPAGQAQAIYPTTVTGTGMVATSTGTFQWTAPDGVTSVCAVCVGGGGGGGSTGDGTGGGGGGGLGWKNNIAVTPGTTYTVIVGAGGAAGSGNGGQSYFIASTLVAGNGGLGGSSGSSGVGGAGGGYVGDGGGNGGVGDRKSVV